MVDKTAATIKLKVKTSEGVIMSLARPSKQTYETYQATAKT